MTKYAKSTPTRVPADVAATAAVVGTAENRSMAEQISYWARLGMQLERSGTATSRKVLAAAAGEAQFSSLTPDERVGAHALVDARISERVGNTRFGPAARAAGLTTVALDDDGNIVELDAGAARRL